MDNEPTIDIESCVEVAFGELGLRSKQIEENSDDSVADLEQESLQMVDLAVGTVHKSTRSLMLSANQLSPFREKISIIVEDPSRIHERFNNQVVGMEDFITEHVRLERVDLPGSDAEADTWDSVIAEMRESRTVEDLDTARAKLDRPLAHIQEHSRGLSRLHRGVQEGLTDAIKPIQKDMLAYQTEVIRQKESLSMFTI